MSKSSRLAAAPLAALVVAALAVGGCGSSNSSSSGSGGSGNQSSGGGGTSASADKAVAAQVPSKYKSKGTLTVAADATYAPNEFIGPDGHTVVGMDADLADAIAGVMGLKADVKNATFDSILPGLASGKYDLGMSSFTDTKEREQTVDFVTYFSAGTSFYVKGQGGPAITSLADLCGKKVAVEKGTTQQTDVEAQVKKCKSAGKPAPSLTTYPDQNGANLALSSGRAEVGMADSPVAAYQVKKSGGQFKLSGQPYGTAPYGIAVPKNSGLDKPVLAAMKKLIADGKYMAILKKWGIQSGAISNPGINQATS
jgi:polar amino acid transport system substrate-binding protein